MLSLHPVTSLSRRGGPLRPPKRASGGLGGSSFFSRPAKPRPVRDSTRWRRQTAEGSSEDPYGRMTKVSGDRNTAFGYTGHFWHGPSGLFLTLYRAYDPNLGRWISRDPMAKAEVQEGPNIYSYVQNNAINYLDHYGLESSCENPCDKAKQFHMDHGDSGGVICYGGGKYACNWGDWKKGAKKEIDMCTIEHEKDHFDDIDCPPVGLWRPRFKEGKDWSEEERKAYNAETSCLIKNNHYRPGSEGYNGIRDMLSGIKWIIKNKINK